MNARAGNLALLVFAAVSTLSMLAACNGDDRGSSPTAIPPPAPPDEPGTPQSTVPNYVGNSVVSSGGCGLQTGSTRTGVLWRVERGPGNSIVFYEDMANYPSDHVTYIGTIEGFRFSAVTGPNGCIVEGSLNGEFELDFSGFLAESTWETLPSNPSGSFVVRQVGASSI